MLTATAADTSVWCRENLLLKIKPPKKPIRSAFKQGGVNCLYFNRTCPFLSFQCLKTWSQKIFEGHDQTCMTNWSWSIQDNCSEWWIAIPQVVYKVLLLLSLEVHFSTYVCTLEIQDHFIMKFCQNVCLNFLVFLSEIELTLFHHGVQII